MLQDAYHHGFYFSFHHIDNELFSFFKHQIIYFIALIEYKYLYIKETYRHDKHIN